MAKRNFGETMICPVCGLNDETYVYGADEVEFSECDNTGHYHANCRCKTCNKNFRVYMTFKYNVVTDYTSK